MTGPTGAEQPSDRLLGFTRGDRGRARALHAQLEVLRDASDDPEFKRLMTRTLNGEIGLREAARTPVFDREVAPRAEEFGRQWDAMSEAEREALAAEGEKALRAAGEREGDLPPDDPRP